MPHDHLLHGGQQPRWLHHLQRRQLVDRSSGRRAAIGNTFHAVSCASPTFCDAEVDNSGDQAQWDSGTWTETTADKSLNVRIGQGPSNVSCAPSSTAKYCVYVDNYNDYSVYDNGTWVDRGSKLFAASYVQTEVSCYAVDRCGAIDDNGDAITYNGSSWSTSRLVDPTRGACRCTH